MKHVKRGPLGVFLEEVPVSRHHADGRWSAEVALYGCPSIISSPSETACTHLLFQTCNVRQLIVDYWLSCIKTLLSPCRTAGRHDVNIRARLKTRLKSLVMILSRLRLLLLLSPPSAFCLNSCSFHSVFFSLILLLTFCRNLHLQKCPRNTHLTWFCLLTLDKHPLFSLNLSFHLLMLLTSSRAARTKCLGPGVIHPRHLTELHNRHAAEPCYYPLL